MQFLGISGRSTSVLPVTSLMRNAKSQNEVHQDICFMCQKVYEKNPSFSPTFRFTTTSNIWPDCYRKIVHNEER